MKERVINLTDKPLRQFTEGDTLYVMRLRGGFAVYYFCKFIRLERGLVIAEATEDDTFGKLREPLIIKTRSKSCYLWGISEDARYPRCHWFKDLDSPAD